MAPEQLTQLISLSLAAMKTGSTIAAAAAPDIQHAARHPQLKAALGQGSDPARQWVARLDQALAEVGGQPAPVNHIMQAHYEVDQRLRGVAQDDDTRDLGIIASAQRALYYWLASFGTLRTYALRAGRQPLAQQLQACLDEARRADEQYTQLAERILAAA